MNALTILYRARTVIDLVGWCQHASAQDKNNLSVSPLSPQAASYCAIGALFKVTNKCALENDNYALKEAKQALIAALPATYDLVSIADYNDADCRTKDEILALFDAAILAQEKLRKQRRSMSEYYQRKCPSCGKEFPATCPENVCQNYYCSGACAEVDEKRLANQQLQENDGT